MKSIEEIGDPGNGSSNQLNVFPVGPVLLTLSLKHFTMILQMFAAHFCKVTLKKAMKASNAWRKSGKGLSAMFDAFTQRNLSYIFDGAFLQCLRRVLASLA